MKTLTELLYDVSGSEIISLAYDEPRTKPKMMEAIVKGYLGIKYPVEYIDFDLQFSSLLQNISDSEFSELFSGLLQVYQPGPTVLDFLGPLADSGRSGGVIIVDSFNTAQNLLSVEPTSTNAISANHRAAVLISALQEMGRANCQTILLLNLTRSRPKMDENSEVIWEKEIVGGRMTKFKSDVILLAQKLSKESTETRMKIGVDSKFSNTFRGELSDEYMLTLNEK